MVILLLTMKDVKDTIFTRMYKTNTNKTSLCRSNKLVVN